MYTHSIDISIQVVHSVKIIHVQYMFHSETFIFVANLQNCSNLSPF